MPDLRGPTDRRTLPRAARRLPVTMLLLLIGILVLAACSAPETEFDQGAALSSETATPSPVRAASPATATTEPPAEPTEPPAPTLEPTATATQEPTAVPTETPADTPDPAPTEPPAANDGVLLNGDPAWQDAIHTWDGARMGVVIPTELNIRSAPTVDAPILSTTFARHTVTVYELVTNPDDGGRWYRIGDGRYVSADYVAPFAAPVPDETFDGHWVDINLSTFYAIAYDGDRPIYSAIISAGRDERTPLGTFNVFYRVEDETMDSATVGIPKGDPEYYYLEHVMFTQYFKEGGFALHSNYWTPPSEFGGFTSNGCISLLNGDAHWFWDFLSEGSTVHIHF